MVLMLIFCVTVGAAVGWGFRNGGGIRGGKIRRSQRKASLSWSTIYQRRKDIKNGAIIGGVFGLVMCGLALKDIKGRQEI